MISLDFTRMIQSCMEGDCITCYVPITMMDERDTSEFSVFPWNKVVKKTRKISVQLDFSELVAEFNTQVSTLKKHIFVKRCQNNYDNSLKNDLKCGELLINVNYSENYVNQEQQKIQNAYFGHDCFSIFTGCCYFRTANGELVNENITVTSEASDHSRLAAYAFPK